MIISLLRLGQLYFHFSEAYSEMKIFVFGVGAEMHVFRLGWRIRTVFTFMYHMVMGKQGIWMDYKSCRIDSCRLGNAELIFLVCHLFAKSALTLVFNAPYGYCLYLQSVYLKIEFTKKS